MTHRRSRRENVDLAVIAEAAYAGAISTGRGPEEAEQDTTAVVESVLSRIESNPSFLETITMLDDFGRGEGRNRALLDKQRPPDVSLLDLEATDYDDFDWAPVPNWLRERAEAIGANLTQMADEELGSSQRAIFSALANRHEDVQQAITTIADICGHDLHDLKARLGIRAVARTH